jgi:hypothetical protein
MFFPLETFLHVSPCNDFYAWTSVHNFQYQLQPPRAINSNLHESSIWLESWTEIDIDIWTYLSWLEASYAPGGSGMACKYIGGYTKVSWVTLSLLLPGFFGRYWYCNHFPKLLSLGRSINHRADHGAKSMLRWSNFRRCGRRDVTEISPLRPNDPNVLSEAVCNMEHAWPIVKDVKHRY